jgi:hypothetical protein
LVGIYGKGSLVGWFDYDGLENMNEWQAREHMAERMTAPGFIRGRRFTAVSACPAHFMFYETSDLGALTSGPYLRDLNNPSDWSRRCSAGLRNMRRSACTVAATVGTTDGGTVATLELIPADRGRLRAALAELLLPRICEHVGVYSAHLLETNAEASGIQTTEKQLRSTPDIIVDWVLVVEGLDPRSVEDGVAALLSPKTLLECGAKELGAPQIYQLAFATQALPYVMHTGVSAESD